MSAGGGDGRGEASSRARDRTAVMQAPTPRKDVSVRTQAQTPRKTPSRAGGLRRMSKSCDDISSLATGVGTPVRSATRPNTPYATPGGGKDACGRVRTPAKSGVGMASRIPTPAKR